MVPPFVLQCFQEFFGEAAWLSSQDALAQDSLVRLHANTVFTLTWLKMKLALICDMAYITL